MTGPGISGPGSVRAYATATSCAQGESLEFRLDGPDEPGATAELGVTVHDATCDRLMLAASVRGPSWRLEVPPDWPSSLYRARFVSGPPEPDVPVPRATGDLPGSGASPDDEVYFVVRQAVPGTTSPILVSIPFATWQAYNRAGVPGESIYWTEQPDRAARVSFDRPGGGPPPERWEDGMLRWFAPAGYTVEYCSGLDLDPDLLSGYRLLVVNGHDEYWTAGMRDACEEFARRGGNIAFFSGNTCWWQIRMEGRTMVCHRDPVTDPVEDPGLTTVEWSSAPVSRPENTLTGVSFRNGAGAWGPYMPLMREESYTARFAAHWAFEGTGLTDGDKFAQGAIGYETDAAEFTEIMGVPRATCRDGTPPSFVVLATADLRHWSACGQGGWATMGVFSLGRGTVFNAATINWGNTLHDPVVDRITRNVLDRLSRPSPPGWEVIGPSGDIRALAAWRSTLYAVDTGGTLLTRELCGQNLRWQPIGSAGGVRCLDSPREAAAGLGTGLYGVTAGGVLRYREATSDPADWTDVGPAPEDTIALAVGDGAFFAATSAGRLWTASFADVASGSPVWRDAGDSGGAICLSGSNGRLYALGADHRVRTRLPVTGPAPWADLVEAPGAAAFTAHAGLLVSAGNGQELRWRTAQKPTGP
ncbi:N,N-dimethylformamidase beta subunit family domain-containing protein [Microtetraspora niveoalba]|uniref:N,N-dimethylformamidase beta subunit family domain-containing protein n=1 Tax=Microtetraspora niveoalba TaxID=46175 RepID=UPI0008317C81|nr:N,N-dimethylformamidase beta subunit family domain-containing protein [Microtetraspora niveoalba]